MVLLNFFLFHVIVINFATGDNVTQYSLNSNDSDNSTTVSNHTSVDSNYLESRPIENLSQKSNEGRIVNGSKAIEGQFAHQVSLRRRYNLRHFCGGSIIASNVILTAAHCMFIANVLINPWTIRVVAGELQLIENDINPAHQRDVISITLHQNFSRSTYENDIAILHVDKPFEFGFEVNYIQLPFATPNVGTVCYAAGWGYQFYNGTVSYDLMYVDLPILSNTVCKKTWHLFEGQFCAGYMKGQKDACQGDSGGGMTCNGKLSGIISSGNGCAWKNYPGVYTDVNYYTPWIVGHIIYEDIRLSKESHGKKKRSAAPALEKSSTLILVTTAFCIILSSQFNFL